MIRFMKAALAVCLAISLGGSANAATVSFAGHLSPGLTTGANGDFAPGGQAYSLLITYTPQILGGGVNAIAVTAAQLTIAGFQPWSVLNPGSTLSIVPNGGGADSLSATVLFAVNGGGGQGTVVANLGLVVNGTTDLGGSPDATAANINSILYGPSGGNSGTANFTFIGGGVNGFGITGSAPGTAQVPEPGSMLLLGGLGMFVGRRAWRRRQAAKSEKAAA